mmetsp:Transcript_56417/g.163639  ORF Transcript_56417/g.163639 Transcript_56417/m.163639 type:complete len:223 (-) Transcript_56417:2020-2688(-)
MAIALHNRTEGHKTILARRGDAGVPWQKSCAARIFAPWAPQASLYDFCRPHKLTMFEGPPRPSNSDSRPSNADIAAVSSSTCGGGDCHASLGRPERLWAPRPADARPEGARGGPDDKGAATASAADPMSVLLAPGGCQTSERRKASASSPSSRKCATPAADEACRPTISAAVKRWERRSAMPFSPAACPTAALAAPKVDDASSMTLSACRRTDGGAGDELGR